jgi:hypothetical protein
MSPPPPHPCFPTYDTSRKKGLGTQYHILPPIVIAVSCNGAADLAMVVVVVVKWGVNRHCSHFTMVILLSYRVNNVCMHGYAHRWSPQHKKFFAAPCFDHIKIVESNKNTGYCTAFLCHVQFNLNLSPRYNCPYIPIRKT